MSSPPKPTLSRTPSNTYTTKRKPIPPLLPTTDYPASPPTSPVSPSLPNPFSPSSPNFPALTHSPGSPTSEGVQTPPTGYRSSPPTSPTPAPKKRVNVNTQALCLSLERPNSYISSTTHPSTHSLPAATDDNNDDDKTPSPPRTSSSSDEHTLVRINTTSSLPPSHEGLIKPPQYTLTVDPLPPLPSSPPAHLPPVYPPPRARAQSFSTPTPFSADQLPTYAKEAETEPHTLSRSLFFWGFLCPLAWCLAVLILFVPLTPDPYATPSPEEPEEEDWGSIRGRHNSTAHPPALSFGSAVGESAAEIQEALARDAVLRRMDQEARRREREWRVGERRLLEEKIVILRKVEIRWSRYSAIALGTEVGLIVVVVLIVIFATGST